MGLPVLPEASPRLTPALPLLKGLCTVLIFCGTFSVPLSLRCCEGRGSAGTWGPSTPVLQLGYNATKSASGHLSSSSSCNGLWASFLKVVKGHHHHQVVLFLASSS